MIRLFESMGAASTRIEIDEDGFAAIRVSHSACDDAVEYASGPLYAETGAIECPRCGEPLLTYAEEEGESVSDASGL